MGKRLGHMIREFREKQGRTIEEAARGLLSAAELSRVENGTKEIEYLIMEALFETYGKSLDKLEIVVSSDEYRILELRDIRGSFAEKVSRCRRTDPAVQRHNR